MDPLEQEDIETAHQLAQVLSELVARERSAAYLGPLFAAQHERGLFILKIVETVHDKESLVGQLHLAGWGVIVAVCSVWRPQMWIKFLIHEVAE